MTKPLSPETLVYGFTPVSDPQISPDGAQILYTRATTDAEKHKGSSQVWIIGTDGTGARQLTESGQKNSGARWSPGGLSIAFVSDRVEKAGIFVLPMHGGEAREVTKHKAGIGELEWSPDGSRIAYTVAVDPEHPDDDELDEDAAAPVRVTRRIDYKQDGRGYLNDKRFQTFVVDVESGERNRVTTEPSDYNFPAWSPDGETIAVQKASHNGMRSKLALVPADGGDETLVGWERGVVTTWGWSPDGGSIILTGDSTLTWQTDFHVYNIASGEIFPLTTDLECLPAGGLPGIQGPAQPRWLEDGTVLFHAMHHGAGTLNRLQVSTGKVEPVTGIQAMPSGFSATPDGRKVVQACMSLESHVEVLYHDLRAGESQQLTNESAAPLAEAPAASWERFDVSRDGYTTEAWMLTPADFDPSKKYPVVLDVHGGPNGFYGYGFVPMQQCLATNGFILVYSNPRGSSSYGREFTQQVTEDWGGEDYHDLMAVVDKVLERDYADGDRVGIWGYSYGGYMTAWTIGQTQRFKAAVCGAPCFDLESMFGTSDISHEFGELQWGGAPHKSREWFATHSPSEFAHRTTTPTLIVHGEADERCPIGQGEQMFVALKKAGCEVEFARYPGGSHGFMRLGPPEHRADVLRRTLTWFKDHLGEPV
jgi:dipeptidyl aminopeptidase/acylaminoacyl peptidase